MKIIKSKLFMQKEAIWSNQDPGLPPGVSEEMISERGAGPEEDVVHNQQEETTIEVKWAELNKLLKEWGRELPSILSNRSDSSFISVKYTYSYDHNNNTLTNIKPIQIKDYATKALITDPDVLSLIVDFYDDEIKADVKMAQEEAMIESQPDYNPFE